jgi:hypothetical protein
MSRREREGGCWEPRGRPVSLMTAAIYQAVKKAMPSFVNWSIIGAIVIATAVILVFALHLIG